MPCVSLSSSLGLPEARSNTVKSLRRGLYFQFQIISSFIIQKETPRLGNKCHSLLWRQWAHVPSTVNPWSHFSALFTLTCIFLKPTVCLCWVSFFDCRQATSSFGVDCGFLYFSVGTKKRSSGYSTVVILPPKCRLSYYDENGNI